MLKIIIKDLDSGSQSNPVDIDWLLFGEEDLEFENGGTLPLNDFKLFRKEYEICLLPAVSVVSGLRFTVDEFNESMRLTLLEMNKKFQDIDELSETEVMVMGYVSIATQKMLEEYTASK